MNHEMKLNPAPYAAIKIGKKNIELRLNDEKRQYYSEEEELKYGALGIEVELIDQDADSPECAGK